MLVASNTSPISNLAIIGRLDLLRVQFREVRVPGAVQSELYRLSHPIALKAIQQAFQDGWIKSQTLQAEKVARLLADSPRSRRGRGYRAGAGTVRGSGFAGRKRWAERG